MRHAARLLLAGACTFLLFATAALPSTGDHASFEILKREFRTGPEVTRACLSCHTEAAEQVMATIHWTWVCPKALAEGEELGKARIVNNFCIALPSNEPRCTSCHAGYGWKDQDFDFSDETRVDCLVCHDSTGTYRKFPTDAGHPAYETKIFAGKTWEPPDLGKIARKVARPTRENCGACHFYGGGGEGVKHADLDASLFHADKKLDVHMAPEGANLACQDCHTTRDHRIAGRCYSVPAVENRTFEFPRSGEDNHIYCESCHGNEPHAYGKLNDHVDRVACQTCHIPTAARRQATKSSWDWSEAGKMDEEGKPYQVKDEEGRVVYDSKKGAFTWARNLVPEYHWFDGSVGHTKLGETIGDSRPVPINYLKSSREDPEARIWPFKVHRGKQVYDPVHGTLVVPKLFGKKGSGAYWAEFDWPRSVAAGMEAVDLPFSGEVGFVETEMYWPITHMVAPAEDALACADCHARGEGGRLASLGGFYMPGRDRFPWLDRLGWLLVFLTVAGVAVHGGLRLALNGRRRRQAPSKRED
jgi:octaheme c-type cytochrome (tetrathionate reductase family)